jgi:hypothetical protein
MARARGSFVISNAGEFSMNIVRGAVAASVAIVLGALTCNAAKAAQSPDVAKATFNPDGSVQLPVGYRGWVHVGTRYKPISANILDGKITKTPEILNAYVEPGAMAEFQSSGKWPQGAQIVKELSTIRVGEGCDPKTYLCITPLGVGIYESGFTGLGMMVKDAKRFPDSPGNWGYFSSGHQAPPYQATSPVRPREKCSACHERLAGNTDYVIVVAHLGLVGASGVHP